MKYKFLLITCLFFGLATAAMAQTGTVQGTVIDENTGEELPGVNIVIAGTTTGTTSNMSGEYSINVNEPGTDLEFTYVGYIPQAITVTQQHIDDGLDVSLESDVALMDEMVVVGFGTQRRGDVTGAVSSISQADIERRPMTNTALGMQGMSPGLTIQNQGGQPGEEDAVIRIRGTGTLNNANPLVLVDGIEQSLASVESSNIETISVLKDAASAAIYGSRAANGVILITTKRGTESGVTVNFNSYTGVQNQLFFVQGASKEDWMMMENEARIATGAEPTFTEEYMSNVLAGTNPLEYPFADFEGGVFRDNAMEYNNSLSIATGGESGRIYAALSHADTDGIMQNFNNKRTSLRINSDLFVTDGLTFKANLLYRNRDVSGPGFRAQRITQALLHMNRDMIMSYPDGRNATGDLIGGVWNPYVMANSGETSRLSDDIVGTVGIDYQINDVLSIEGDVTMNRTTTEESIFREDRSNMIHPLTGDDVAASTWFSTNTLNEGRYNRRELSQRLFMNYAEDFGNHGLSGMAGYEELHTRATQASAARSGFFSNDLRNLSAGDPGNEQTCTQFNDPGSYTSGCFNDEWRVRSFFGRANYAYDDRYSVQANVRYDGSSRFAEGNRWGFFPSFSAGWRISSEEFMQDVDLFSNLRARASWGQLGNERQGSNERTGLNSYLNSYNLGLSYQFGDGVVPASAVTSAGNPDIAWETTTMTNLGLDMGFLDDRIEVIGEYFWNYTSDILLVLPIPATVGVSAPYQNAADVSNNGWELAVNYHSAPSMDRGFQYSIGVNLSDAVNTIENLSGQGPFYPDGFTVWTEGESINSLRGYASPGIYRNQEDLDKYPTTYSPNVTIGDLIYEDLDESGTLSTAMYPEGDHIVIANEDPRYEFGVNFDASYRGFDFIMFWQGVAQQHHMLDGAVVEGPNNQNFIVDKYVQERYHPELNPDGTWPRVMVGSQDWNRRASEFWLQDTKYARLKNIQLGYTIPQQLAQNLRVFVSGKNLVTLTPTELFDPEAPRGRNQFYPHSKSVEIGLNVTF
ncbi:MAG: TonB-dependent receptor [Balneolales bacterium]